MEKELPKSMITIAVLASAIICGILLAKVVDAFHDRQSIRDDVSDISDYTRDLLKEQLSVAFTKGQKLELQPEDLAKTYFKMWASKMNKLTPIPPLDDATVENGNIPDTGRTSETASIANSQHPQRKTSSLPASPKAVPVTPPHGPQNIQIGTRDGAALAPIEITEDKKYSPSKASKPKKK